MERLSLQKESNPALNGLENWKKRTCADLKEQQRALNSARGDIITKIQSN